MANASRGFDSRRVAGFLADEGPCKGRGNGQPTRRDIGLFRADDAVGDALPGALLAQHDCGADDNTIHAPLGMPVRASVHGARVVDLRSSPALSARLMSIVSKYIEFNVNTQAWLPGKVARLLGEFSPWPAISGQSDGVDAPVRDRSVQLFR